MVTEADLEFLEDSDSEYDSDDEELSEETTDED